MKFVYCFSLCCTLGFPGYPIDAQSVTDSLRPSPPPLYRICQNGRYGFIDSTGAVRIQPIFKTALPFSEGLAAVREKGRFGYIDVNGRFAIAPEFEYAEPFEAGKATVWVVDKKMEIDHQGARKEFTAGNEFNPALEDYSSSEALEREAHLLYFEEITPVYKGRRFALDKDYKWFLTDEKGAKLSPVPFKEVFMLDSGPIQWEEIWKDGLAFVKTQDGVGAIDMDGNFKVPIKSFGFETRHFSRWGDIVVFSKDTSTQNSGYNLCYGFWDWRKNLVVAPRFYSIEETAFLHGGLIAVLEGDQSGYINRSGEYVWREPAPSLQAASSLNIDYMLEGDFYAASPPKKEFNGFGGWADSDNFAKKIQASQDFIPGKIQLKANPGKQKNYRKKYLGFPLWLANTTTDTLVLEAQDSRLDMLLQAKDSTGTWRDIMYLSNSSCGNSYHRVFLAPGEYWEFPVLSMEGEFQTKIRVVLKKDRKNTLEFISNEFDGGINPAQFWRQ